MIIIIVNVVILVISYITKRIVSKYEFQMVGIIGEMKRNIIRHEMRRKFTNCCVQMNKTCIRD